MDQVEKLTLSKRLTKSLTVIKFDIFQENHQSLMLFVSVWVHRHEQLDERVMFNRLYEKERGIDLILIVS